MRIFIGSSNEQYPVVKEIKRDLMAELQPQTVEIVTWKEWFKRGVNYGLTTWAVIMNAIDYFDCAIMLLAGDDRTEIRDHDYLSTRDNVLIESGTFAHAIGIDRVFLLIDKNDQYRLPSDYHGLNAISFDYSRGADNPDAYATMLEKILQIETLEIQKVTTAFNPDKMKEKDQNLILQKEKRGKIK